MARGHQKTDLSAVTPVRKTDASGAFIYGPNIWSIVNPLNGEELARCEGQTTAILLAAQLIADLQRRLAQ